MQEVEISLIGVIGYCSLYYTVIPLTFSITSGLHRVVFLVEIPCQCEKVLNKIPSSTLTSIKKGTLHQK